MRPWGEARKAIKAREKLGADNLGFPETEGRP